MASLSALLWRSRPEVLVSAHRCSTLAQVEHAVDLGVDYVEFDVQRCKDGTFVVSHDTWVTVDGHHLPIASLTLPQLEALSGPAVRYESLLAALRGRAMAHLDLKFGSPGELYPSPPATYEVEAVREAVDVLGAENLLVTTLDDASVRAVRDWSERECPGLLVGLSLGRSVRGLSWWRQVRVRVSELVPRVRFRHSRANLVVAKHTLARLGVSAFARHRRLPLLVWTVDTEDSLRYWFRPGRAFLVTTNQPALALEVRRGAVRRGRLRPSRDDSGAPPPSR